MWGRVLLQIHVLIWVDKLRESHRMHTCQVYRNFREYPGFSGPIPESRICIKLSRKLTFALELLKWRLCCHRQRKRSTWPANSSQIGVDFTWLPARKVLCFHFVQYATLTFQSAVGEFMRWSGTAVVLSTRMRSLQSAPSPESRPLWPLHRMQRDADRA